MSKPAPSGWRRYVRVPDIGWVLLFTFLAALGPIRTVPEMTVLAALGLFQLAEPRVPYFETRRGAVVSVTIKFLLAYLLIGYTQGLASSYYTIMLLPVISAATTLGPWWTTTFTTAAGLAYLSFALLIDWRELYIPLDQVPELLLRVCTLSLVGFLTYQLAKDNRQQAQDALATAGKLAEANRNLQAAADAMRRADRLAALGQLTAGLAHELRNPLSTIKSSSELLRQQVPAENDVARELTGFIATEVDRTNSLISRFLDFARPLQQRPEPTDVHQVLDRAVANLARQPVRDVSFVKNYGTSVPLLPLDSELMERVFFNLLLNAAQASPEGGVVTIKTRADGDWVEVAVIDRGTGIAPEHRESIFNPFFTTKPEGVGLGLAIVSKIVDEHGGRILVESELEQGSVFRVVLPVAS